MVESCCLHMGTNETPLDQGLSFWIVIFLIVQERSSPSKKNTTPYNREEEICPIHISIIVKRFGLFYQF